MGKSTTLKDMLVLVIDCQTSGSNVESSQLLEIGWLPVRAAEADTDAHHLPCVRIVKPPEDWQLPARIEKLTGIDGQALKDGVPSDQAWQELCAAARRLADRNGLSRCPAVIHYARFEMGFITRLAAQSASDKQVPFETICTHQIASRLLPSLPRKGLRAVAGYLGHSVGKHKRCLDHLLATRTIWQQLVRRLDAEHDITTLDQLRQWLQLSPQTGDVKRTYPMPKEARANIPQTPGVYYLHRSNNDLLYIGKATNLRQRINSYFHAGARHTEKTLEMLSQAIKLEVIATPSALEAALLESDQIKQLEPPYNLALTSNQRQIYFVSRDFEHRQTRPDATCKLGPVLHLAPFEAAVNIASYLVGDKSTIETADVPHVLAMPQQYCPDPECLLDGIHLFKTRHHDLLDRTSAIAGLIRIGRWSWIEKINQKQAAPASDMETQEETPDEPFEWSPEAVVKSLESIVRHCGFLLRRARWISMLSEATLAWQTKSPSSDQHHVIILSKGSIVERFFARADQRLPDPPGANTAIGERQDNLDLLTHDRMRILTTEIRRLIAERRPLRIRLRKEVCLRASQINSLLRWI